MKNPKPIEKHWKCLKFFTVYIVKKSPNKLEAIFISFLTEKSKMFNQCQVLKVITGDQYTVFHCMGNYVSSGTTNCINYHQLKLNIMIKYGPRIVL